MPPVPTLWVETLPGRACEFLFAWFSKDQQRTKPRERLQVHFAREGLGLLCDRRDNLSVVLFHNKQ